MATIKITYAPHFEEESRPRFKRFSEIAPGLSAARRMIVLYEQNSDLIAVQEIDLTRKNPHFRSWHRLSGAKGVPYAVRVIEIMPEDEQGVIEVIVHAALPRDDDTYETHVAELWKQYRTPM